MFRLFRGKKCLRNDCCLITLHQLKLEKKKINNTAFRYFMTILLDRKVQFIKFGKVEKEDVQSAEIEIGHNSPKAVKRINKPGGLN